MLGAQYIYSHTVEISLSCLMRKLPPVTIYVCSLEARFKPVSPHFWKTLEPFLSLLLLFGVGFCKEIYVFFLLSLMGQGHSPLRVIKNYHHPDCHHVYTESCNHQITRRYWNGGGGRRGTGHNIQKNNITIGHDKNWLEPTRSKMAKDLELQCMLIVIVVA